MRVPSIGLPLDERRIVREGYRLAEQMLANYQDPPSLAATVSKSIGDCRETVWGLYRTLVGQQR